MHSFLRYLGAAGALIAAAACSDTATRSSAPDARSLSPEAPVFDYASSGHSFGTQSADFNLTAHGGSFSVNGLYTLTFPENSVCDPAHTTYGPSNWDDACLTLADGQSIKVHAVLSLSGGRLAVDFTPELRFSPSTNVTISTDVFANVLKAGRDYFINNPSSLNFLAVYYTPSLGAAPVSDFATDPSLITHVNLVTGRVWRRIKHFSGYSQTAGTACTPDPNNPDCIVIDDTKQP